MSLRHPVAPPTRAPLSTPHPPSHTHQRVENCRRDQDHSCRTCARRQVQFVGDGFTLQKFWNVTFSSTCAVISVVRSYLENVCGTVANRVRRRWHETAEILTCHIFFNVYSNLDSALMLWEYVWRSGKSDLSETAWDCRNSQLSHFLQRVQ